MQFHGTGLRSLFGILSALSDSAIRVILIDEPELSLEPILQKRLRDLLIDESKDRAIVVATHSHLFLNREEPAFNQVIQSKSGLVSVNPVATQEDLFDLVFKLLGNDTVDLFFPANYLVVEGASDQYICERVLTLLDVPRGGIKVLAAGGTSRVGRTIQAVLDSCIPLIVHDSPYAGRVVALIDSPTSSEEAAVKKLRDALGDRLYILGEPSIEDYLPESLYGRAGRSKEDDLQKLSDLRSRGNLPALNALKREISEQVGSVLMAQDLDEIPTIKVAIERAAMAGAPDNSE